MPKYRKKPVVIDAEQYVKYGKLVKGMCNSISCYSSGNNEPHVHTIHDNQIVNLKIGDYIIPEPDGIDSIKNSGTGWKHIKFNKSPPCLYNV